MPATDNHFVVANLEKIAVLDAVYTIAVYGRFLGPVMSWFDVKPDSELYARTAKLGVFVLLIVGLVAGSGVVILVKGLRRRAVTDKEVVYLYIAMTLIYIAVISCLLVSFENNRNRVMIEPLLVVYVASWIKDYIDKRSSRLREPA
jgi:cytochrome bd-type quinol oxidase subunit 2